MAILGDLGVKVVHSGSATTNVTVNCEHGQTDNGARVKATNSPNPPP